MKWGRWCVGENWNAHFVMVSGTMVLEGDFGQVGLRSKWIFWVVHAVVHVALDEAGMMWD